MWCVKNDLIFTIYLYPWTHLVISDYTSFDNKEEYFTLYLSKLTQVTLLRCVKLIYTPQSFPYIFMAPEHCYPPYVAMIQSVISDICG